jgi:hypothetical protein
VPASRSRTTANPATAKISSGVSSCRTVAIVSSPNCLVPSACDASLKLAVFWRCASRKIVEPLKLSTPVSKKPSGARGLNTRKP